MDDLVVGRFSIPEHELHETFTTSGGPGGQHANRSNTAVEIRFDAASSQAFPDFERNRLIEILGPVVTVTASESRSQWRNRAMARQRLGRRLEEALRPVPERRPTSPSRSARVRRLESKRQRSQTKRLRRRPDQW